MDQQAAPAPWLARVPDWARRPGVVLGTGIAATVVVVVAIVFLRPPAGPKPALVLPKAGEASGAALPGGTESGGAPPGSVAAGSPPSSTTGMVTVHAAGAVTSPGVYALPAGARVSDVVVAAGGPVPEADLDRLNLAAKVADGDRVYVPRKGEPVPSADGGGTAGTGTGDAGGSSGSGSIGGSMAPSGGSIGSVGGPGGGRGAAAGPIDLNTATVEQLDTLPGIGPATAQAIVTYRTRHGRFRSVTELLEVPGIGPAKLEAVRPLVKV